MRVGAILVAAGRSTRMGFDKVWAPLDDRPVAAWSLEALRESGVVDRVVLVVAEARFGDAGRLIAEFGLPVITVTGGERRRDSVLAGLDVLDDCDIVLVHDAARPFVTPRLIRDAIEAVRPTGAAVAAVPVRDTVKRVRAAHVLETLRREELWAVQTPQVFRRELLHDALASSAEDVTDEATLVERMGGTVRIFPGDPSNLKITTPADLDLSHALLRVRPRGPLS